MTDAERGIVSTSEYVRRRSIPWNKLQGACPPGLRELLKQLLQSLAAADPEPPVDFERWGLLRYTVTLDLMRRHLGTRGTIMDISSESYFSYLATRVFPEVVWLPTEVSETSARFTSRTDGRLLYDYAPRSLLLKPERLALPSEARVDLVTLFEVVEHLPWNPSSLFGSISDALSVGGLFILSTPNIGSLAAVLRQLHGGAPYQTPLLEPGFWYHKREYAPWELKQLLNWAGFHCIEIMTCDTALHDPSGWEGRCHKLCLLFAAALSFSAIEVRNLLYYSGSNTFIVARKAKPCDWNEPYVKV